MVPAQRQPTPDLPVQPASLPLGHGQVPGERGQQLDVLLGRVDALPVVLPHRRDLEQPARLDLGPLVGQLAGPREPRVRRQRLADLVVDVLELAEERVAAVGKHVLGRPEGEVTAGAQGLPGPSVPHGRVDPVPRGGRVHQGERPGRRPVLERRPHHLDLEARQVLPGHRGQAGAELDAGDRETAPGQRPGRLAGRAAHLEQAITRGQPGQRDQVVKQGAGIVGSDPVVALRRRVERLPQPLALLLRRHAESISHR